MHSPTPVVRLVCSIVAAAALLVSSGCSTMSTAVEGAYYGVLEQVGYHKRDLLVERISDARDQQEDAKDHFVSVIDRFAEVADLPIGELQSFYNQMKSDLDNSEAKAKGIRDKIASIEDVANDLFLEWEKELEQFSNPDLRSASGRELVKTRARYDKVIAAMKKADSKMEPVLVAFRDQVLFLKHNLNAQAILALRKTRATLEADTSQLIADMERSIDEANQFIDLMKQQDENG